MDPKRDIWHKSNCFHSHTSMTNPSTCYETNLITQQNNYLSNSSTKLTELGLLLELVSKIQNQPCPEIKLNTFGSRTVGRCCETDERPDASEAWSRDAWLVYDMSVDPRRLESDDSGSTSPFTAVPGGAGAVSFGCSRVLFSMMIVNRGRYSAEIRACDDCSHTTTNTIH